jgi:hypothetical protein
VAINTTIMRWGRSIGMAGLIFAASGMLQVAGQPLFDIVGEVALNLAAAQSEAEKLRRRVGLLRLSRIQQELATETPRISSFSRRAVASKPRHQPEHSLTAG